MLTGEARKRWAYLALLALAYIYYLPASGILGPDEARYAAIGQHMASSGDWVTPVLWGSPWFEKPPLLYWLIAAASSCGISPDWAVRLPIVFASLGLAALLPSLEAMLVLSTSFGWLALSQVAVTDIPLSVCFHLWLFFTIRQRPWLAGGFLGLAILAKGLVPLVLAIPVAVLYWREWRHWVTALLVASPWYIACYLRNGQVFVDEFLWKHHVSRFLSPELQHVQPWWFYLPVLCGLFLPWTPALVARSWEEEDRPYAYTALWGLFFFSVSTNKLPTYLLPILPSLAMLAGRRLRRFHYIVAAALFAFLPAFAAWIPTAIDAGITKASAEPIAWTFLGLSALAGALAFRWPRPALVAAFLLSLLSLKTMVYPQLAGRVTAKGRAKVCVPEGSSRGYRYSLYYYAQREVPDCPSASPAPQP